MKDPISTMPVGGEGEARPPVVAGEGKLSDRRSGRTKYRQDPGRGRSGIGEAGDPLEKQVDLVGSGKSFDGSAERAGVEERQRPAGLGREFDRIRTADGRIEFERPQGADIERAVAASDFGT